MVSIMNRNPRPARFSRTLALIPPAVALVAQHANAAFIGYLKVETAAGGTIAGESAEKSHPGWINAYSFGYGVANTVNLSNGQISSAHSPKASEFIIGKQVDKASPDLFLACALGTVLPTVTLELTRVTAGTTSLFYRITLNNVIIGSVNTGGSVTDLKPAEQVSVSYQKIKLESWVVNESTGSTTVGPSVTWDISETK